MKNINKNTPPTQYFRFPLIGGGLRGSFGFTLVELIVVISILAILGTIAFLSFGGFSSKARDGSRISDTASLSKGLELYQVQSGKYPIPENITGTGIIGTTTVAYKGEIQDQISSLTKISKTPKDPLSSNYYIYGTTADYKQYQIATTLENSIALNKITQTIYADGPTYQARVTGNYKGLIKFTASGTTDTWIANIPSLIYDNGTNLISTGTYYSVNKNTNLPYKIKDAITNNKTADILIKEIVNTSATLTGVQITSLTQTGITAQFTGALLVSFGGDISSLTNTILGTSSTITTQEEEIPTPTYSCTGSLILANANISNNTNLTQDTAYQTTNSSASCYYTCKAGYSGANCEIYSKFPGEDSIAGTADDCDTNNITLANGQVWSACNLGAKTAFNGTNAGTYQPSGSTTRGGDDNVNGKLYQWGRNKGFTSSDTTQLSTQLTTNPNSNDTYNFVWNSTLTNYDWLNPQQDTIWGGSATDSATSDGQTNDTLRKGPCPTGWHIPSAKEFQDACTSINGGTTCTNGIANTSMRTTLLLPYAGYRSRSTGLYNSQSTRGYYWSSSPSATNGFYLFFSSTNVRPTNAYNRAYGFSVRCIKD